MAWYDSLALEKYDRYISDPNRASLRDSIPAARDDALSNPDNPRTQRLQSWSEQGNSLNGRQLAAMKSAIEDTDLEKGNLSSSEFEAMIMKHHAIKGLSADDTIDHEFIAALFQALDTDSSDTIDASELKFALAVFSESDPDVAISRLFTAQSGGNRTLARSDIEELMRRNLAVAESKEALEDKEIEGVKKRFEEVAPTGKMDQAGLAKALGYPGEKNSAGIARIFQAFDRDASGYIDIDEFIAAVRSLNDDEVAVDQRLLLAFAEEDFDGSGVLDKDEIRRVLVGATTEGKLEMSPEALQLLVDGFMAQADPQGTGEVKFEQFAAIMKRDEKVARTFGLGNGHIMTLKEGSKDKKKRKKSQGSFGEDFWYMFEGWTQWHMIIVGVYLASVALLVYSKCEGYSDELTALLDPVSLCLARGSAGAIMFSCVWILLPMCRTFMTFLRNNGPRSFPWDEGIEFHKFVALFILVMTLVHCGGHVHNYYRIATASWDTIEPVLGPSGSGAFSAKPTVWEALLAGPSLTGFAMLAIFVVSYACCSERIRGWILRTKRCCFGWCYSQEDKEGNFNIFWYTHHLFLAFLILLCFHGYWHWLAKPSAYQYVLPCLSIFIVEKSLRGCLLRWKERDERVWDWLKSVFTLRSKLVVFAKQHKKSKALEIHVQKPDRLRYLAGQYCFINVPSLSYFEWHPFTLTSAPNEDTLKFHIAAAGDWTKQLYELFPPGWEEAEDRKGSAGVEAWIDGKAKLKESLQEGIAMCPDAHLKHEGTAFLDSLMGHRLKVYIDGPYGAPAQDFTKYKVAMLIGAGIGVTPFAAVLRDVLHTFRTWRDVRDPLQGLQELTNGAAGFPIDFQLEKVYFHWSTRSQQSLGWFTDMMNDLCEQDDDGMLTMYNYLTSVKLAGERKSVLDIARQGAKDATGREAVTGLKADHINLIFARPDFDKTFQDMREKHPNTKIGVFFCGPKVIKNMLAKCCRKYSGKGDNETRFKLHAENF